MNNVAEDINNRAQVVGASDLPGDTTAHAFLWQNGIMTDLGTLPGDVSSGATGINDKSLIVGNSCDVNSNCRAFIYEGGIMTDLNTLIPADSPLYLLLAASINSSGEIVGLAVDTKTAEPHGFMLTPKPALFDGESPLKLVAEAAIKGYDLRSLPSLVERLEAEK